MLKCNILNAFVHVKPKGKNQKPWYIDTDIHKNNAWRGRNPSHLKINSHPLLTHPLPPCFWVHVLACIWIHVSSCVHLYAGAKYTYGCACAHPYVCRGQVHIKVCMCTCTHTTVHTHRDKEFIYAKLLDLISPSQEFPFPVIIGGVRHGRFWARCRRATSKLNTRFKGGTSCCRSQNRYLLRFQMAKGELLWNNLFNVKIHYLQSHFQSFFYFYSPQITQQTKIQLSLPILV